MRIRNRALLIAGTRIGQSLVGMAISILLARTLEQHRFGAYQQAFLVGSFVFGLLAPHLSNSLYYFVVRDRPDGCRRHFVNNVAALLGVTVTASLLLLALAGPIARGMNNPDLVREIRIFAAYPVLHGLLGQIEPALIAVDRAWSATRLLALGLALRLGAVVAALILTGDVTAILVAHLAAIAVTVAIAGPVVWRALPGRAAGLDLGAMREQLTYTLPLAAATIVGTINLQLDRFLMSAFYPPERFAVYSVGSIELPFIGFVTAALGTALLPELVQHATRGDLGAAGRLWRALVEKSLVVLMPTFCFFLAFGGDFLVALYGADYAEARWPFTVYLVRLPLRALAYGLLWRALDRNAYTVRAVGLSIVVNLVVSLSLLLATHDHPFGFVAPAVGTVAGTFAAASWQQVLVARTFGAPVLPFAFAGRALAVGAVALAPALALHGLALPAVVRLLTAGALFAALFGVLATAAGLLARDEWELAARLVPFSGARTRLLRLAAALGRWPQR